MDATTATMSDLKDVKYLMYSGKLEEALRTARRHLMHAGLPTSALLEHRVAMIAAQLGWHDIAEDSFMHADAQFMFQVPHDHLGYAIFQRDWIRYQVQCCTLSHDEPRKGFEAESLANLVAVRTRLQALQKTARIELEIAVTEAFINRHRLHMDPGNGEYIRQLVPNWQRIRKLRGNTKPIYELDALDAILKTSHVKDPVVHDAHVRRAIRLSLQVGNVNRALEYGAMPAGNLVIKAGSKVMRYFFD